MRDDGTVPGIQAELDANAKARDGYQLHLFNKLKQDIGGAAATAVQISFQEHNGAVVCVVRVPPSPMPVYVRHDGQQLLFARLGNQCDALDAKQAHDYAAKRWT